MGSVKAWSEKVVECECQPHALISRVMGSHVCASNRVCCWKVSKYVDAVQVARQM